MKIYWSNLLWNCTIRYWYVFKYYLDKHHLSKWPNYYNPSKLYWNSKQKEELDRLIGLAMKHIKFIKPGYYPHSDGDEF